METPLDQLRPLLINASEYDTSQLLIEWRWVVPETATPLFVSAFGDWVFGHPDSWQTIAAGHDMRPSKDQCLGWKLHPLLGGKFDVANLQLFSNNA